MDLLSQLLTMAGAIGGILIAFIAIALITKAARNQARKEFRHHLSIGSIIYNARDWD